jgi:membrane-associated phospholipid phosphatase
MVAATALVAVLGGQAAADDPGPLEADPVTDGVFIAGAAVVALAMRWVHLNDAPEPWDRELFGSLDARVRAEYSPRARRLSDLALATSIVVPAGLAIGTTWDRAAGDRALEIAEALASALVVTSVTKTLVGRPRPYTYNAGADPKAYATKRGRDARRSFFSGHAATAFASLAAGGALYAGREPDRTSRAVAWGAGAMLAAATANWRIRAGEHFYSDILVGALVGAAAGTIVPAFHTGGVYRPSGTELAALAGGLVVGATISQLLPLVASETDPAGTGFRVELTPLVLPSGGGGLGLAGAF